MKDEAEFIHQGDVDVALGVFDHFGGFCHLDAAGFVGACGDDLLVELVHLFGHRGRAATGDLFDGGKAVFFVAGVDALGAVATEKVLVELEAAEFFEHRHAHLFCGTWIHSRFVNDDVARLEHFSHGFTGFD